MPHYMHPAVSKDMHNNMSKLNLSSHSEQFFRVITSYQFDYLHVSYSTSKSLEAAFFRAQLSDSSEKSLLPDPVVVESI